MRSVAAAICAWSVVPFGVPDAALAQNVVSAFDTLSTVLEPGDRVRVIDRDGLPLIAFTAAVAGGGGLGVGAAIDALSQHWRPVYNSSETLRVTVTPMFADRRRGIRLAIAF